MSGSRRKQPLDETQQDLSPEELLSTSPFDRDVTEELASAPPPRRKLPKLTLSLAGVVLLMAGFLIGIQADKTWGSGGKSSAASSLSSLLSAARSGRSGAGSRFGGPGGTSGGGTTGTIKLVDGSTIYVQESNGTVLIVDTNTNTKISIAKSGTTSDLKAGQTVTIEGTSGSNGTMTATSVTSTPGG
jgi:hypothetical protein